MIGIIFSVIVSLILPIAILVYYIIKRDGRLMPFILGVLTFTVFQVLTRVPLILEVLPKQVWYINLNAFYPLLAIALLAISAALFEECGRYIVMKLFMRKRQTLFDGIAFGLGHGGVEAVLLVGINAFYILINYSAFSYISPIDMFWGGMERALVIPVHVAWSVLILRGIAKGRVRHLFLAIVTHALIDFIFPSMVLFGCSTMTTELLMAACSVIAIAGIIYLKRVYYREKDLMKITSETISC